MAKFDSTALLEMTERFARDGFLVLEGLISPDRVDEINAEVERVIAERPHEVVVDNKIDARRTYWADAAYRDTLRLKFNDLYLISDVVRGAVLDSDLVAVLNQVMGQPVGLCGSLNFYKGSTDHLHIDSLFMTPATEGHLVATWTALEDVSPDAGPVTYWPGSHRIPLYRFSDGSRHALREEMPAWLDYIKSEIADRGLEEHTFFAKKGDILIWHSDLVHSGSFIKDYQLTRRSLVCHYFSEEDLRNSACDIQPLNGAYWMRRLPHPVVVHPDVFTAGRSFPEQQYLARHPDVAQAVKDGVFDSGLTHYTACGYREGRGI